MKAQRKNPVIMAPLLVAGLIGSADAKTVKGEICPTKVSGLIKQCKEGKKCVLRLKEGDVLTDIEYFGSRNCSKKTGFTKVEVSKVDGKGVAFRVKGMVLPGMKKDRFEINFGNQTKIAKALGMSAGKTRNPKVARLMLRR